MSGQHRSTAPPVRVINGKKTFIPLENNPESLTRLSNLLHLHNLSFHDIFSLDLIIQDIPRPVHALIFITPAPVWYQVRENDPKRSEGEDHNKGETGNKTQDSNIQNNPQGPPITWFKQTIGHSCGLMALIHAITNGKGSNHISSRSPLSSILERYQYQPQHHGETTDNNKNDEIIAQNASLLYNSSELEKAHMTAAAEGDTTPPDPSEPNGMHFICFVKDDYDRLWELEGGRDGPVFNGRLDTNSDVNLDSERDQDQDQDQGQDQDPFQDVLSPKAIRLGPGKYLEKGREMGISEFSCVALVLDGDI